MTQIPKQSPLNWTRKSYESEQAQRAIEREIRRWKRAEAIAVTDEQRERARRQTRFWQAQMRTHLKENPQLRRIPQREKLLGVTPFEKRPGDRSTILEVAQNVSSWMERTNEGKPEIFDKYEPKSKNKSDILDRFSRNSLRAIDLYNSGKGNAYDVAVSLGYVPLRYQEVVPEMRKESRIWINNLSPAEKRSIQKYTDNGSDSDGKKLYQKINGYLSGRYNPSTGIETEMLERNIVNIKKGLSKSKTSQSVIVYRYDTDPNALDGTVKNFISTSVSSKGVLYGKHNVTIIVPEGSSAGYLEQISGFPRQRELLINLGQELRLIGRNRDEYLYWLLPTKE